MLGLLSGCDTVLFRSIFVLETTAEAGANGSGTGGNTDEGGGTGGVVGMVLLQPGAGAMILRHGDFLYCQAARMLPVSPPPRFGPSD
jgi:hypothetical protein